MRIVIDMQGAQTASRTRGIGRYSLSLARAIARNRGPHEVILALNGLFPETIQPIRRAFAGLLPRHAIHVWEAPGPIAGWDPANEPRRRRAELVYEAFLASLEPDIVHVSSVFEGFVDDAATSIGALGRGIPTSATLYDLIPLHDPERFLAPDPAGERFYRQKLGCLQRADLLLAISEFTARDATERLTPGKARIVNVSAACDSIFRPLPEGEVDRAELASRLDIEERFVLTSGTIEPHKNLRRVFEAVAALPMHLRKDRSLVLVGMFVGSQRQMLEKMATRAGLRDGELVVTGYVADDDLLRLYNSCELMVLPSLDEGFGLPVLEAMACGAPTVGSRAASVPEIIGRDDALFDPMSVEDMTRVIGRALEDETFRMSLRESAAARAPSFSWDSTAQRALEAMQALVTRQRRERAIVPAVPAAPTRPRLAFISPLPPDRSGIADYSGELLPALAEHYDITLISSRHKIDRSSVDGSLPIQTPQWLRTNVEKFDRILYQMGNSPFHDYMLDLVKEVPGTVILHDFFLSSLLSWLELTGHEAGAWTRALYDSHGYLAVRDRFNDPQSAKVRYPANLDFLRNAMGVIVHSEHAKTLAGQWFGPEIAQNWRVVPQLKSETKLPDRSSARQRLRIHLDAFVVCSFGAMDPTKLNVRLLDGFRHSLPGAKSSNLLVFVGTEPIGPYAADVRQRIESMRSGAAIRVSGWTDRPTFECYLAAADVAVQLRTQSRGETSRAILDCMAAGLPTIINAHGSSAELSSEAALILEDDFADGDLTAAIDSLFSDPTKRRALSEAARAAIVRQHAPDRCAAGYSEAIEAFHAHSWGGIHSVATGVARIDPPMSRAEVKTLAGALARSLPQRGARRRLLLDVTETVRRDRRTGIERVARALLQAFLETAPDGLRIEPVYLTRTDGIWHYRFASRFTLSLLGCPTEAVDDDIVEPNAGDILLTLDLSGQHLIEAAASGLYTDLRNRGLAIYGTVYDLLPVTLPHLFPAGSEKGHDDWLRVIAGMDGAICISRAVADELAAWVGRKVPDRKGDFRIGWFHLGADIENSVPTHGLPDSSAAVFDAQAARPTFLMVSTIEPRKGYLQALGAFDRLWADGVDVNLIVVGAEGWTQLPEQLRSAIPEIVSRLGNSPEWDRRLFWLAGISDEYLERVYAGATCLIFASEGEGFGLPLIEAARHGLPILARDIPVFREVAGDHAAYFHGLDPADLASAVTSWLALHRNGLHPRSDGMPWTTWKESAAQVAQFIRDGDA